MRWPSLNYYSLLILYGASAATALPFAVGYAYAHSHGWKFPYLLATFLFAGVALALIVWAQLEPRLLAYQQSRLNSDAAGTEEVFGIALATTVAVVVFTPGAIITPLCRTTARTTTASSLSFEFGVQSDHVDIYQDAFPNNNLIAR